MHNEMLPLKKNGETVHAGFWRRFGACWIDFLVAVPFLLVFSLLENIGRQINLIASIPHMLFFCCYTIYFHARWGGTLGKMAMGIRITHLDGTRIGYREALLRDSVDVFFGLIALAAQMIALTHLTDAEFDALGWRQRSQQITALLPAWYWPFMIASQVWIWSEFVVLLCNKRRRAIHDFIAGTVVIKQKFVKSGTTLLKA